MALEVEIVLNYALCRAPVFVYIVAVIAKLCLVEFPVTAERAFICLEEIARLTLRAYWLIRGGVVSRARFAVRDSTFEGTF